MADLPKDYTKGNLTVDQKAHNAAADVYDRMNDGAKDNSWYNRPRQAVKVEPTDDAHTTTHRAPGDD